jgi:hypothetical protein
MAKLALFLATQALSYKLAVHSRYLGALTLPI